jgi:hypothetical protein
MTSHDHFGSTNLRRTHLPLVTNRDPLRVDDDAFIVTVLASNQWLIMKLL